MVEVTVQNVEAGEEVTTDVSPPSTEESEVSFSDIAVTVKRGGDFSLRVTNSRAALPGSPPFEPAETADALGRVRLDHSISNDDVEAVSITFRVSKGHLAATDTDPESVALYRFADGEWNALPTDVVAETTDGFRFTADSPGMSEFAIGARRPAFDLFWADTGADVAATGEPVGVSGRVSNVGAADGVYEAALIVDGEVVATRTLTIAAGGTRQVNFQTSFARSGSHVVAVDDVEAGAVAVDDGPAERDDRGLWRLLPVGLEYVLDPWLS